MQLSGAQIIIQTLIEQQTDIVFGYPGGAVLDIYDELYKNADKISHILAAHEQGAAYAADGYARATGKVGVVISTSGPGATNLVTGIANSFLDSTPMVIITGNVDTSLLGKDSFQEVDIFGITLPITKHSFIIRDINELSSVLNEAYLIAKTGRPGPVLIDIPKDIQSQKCDYHSYPSIFKKSIPTVSDFELNEAAELIAIAKKPLIYCGGGVIIASASNEVIELSNKISAPIGTSMMGVSAIPYSFEKNLGMVGMHGRIASTKAKSEADLIIAVGTRFSDRATGDKTEYAKNTKFIHIDIDPAEINKNIQVQVPLIGDVKATLKRLNSIIDENQNSNWQKEIFAFKQLEKEYEYKSNKFTPKNIIKKVNEFCRPDTIIATDVGQHQIWVAQYYKFEQPRTHLTSGGLGAMGYGLGAAIGACLGKGKQKTVLFTGDGSFGMNLNELATAVSYKLPIVVVIMNNGVLGMVRQWQSTFYENRFSQTTLDRKTDFVKLAEAFGGRGFIVNTLDELDRVLKQAFAINELVVVDCKIDIDEKVLPMIPPGGSIKDIILN